MKITKGQGSHYLLFLVHLNVLKSRPKEPVAQYTRFEWTIGSAMRNNAKP